MHRSAVAPPLCLAQGHAQHLEGTRQPRSESASIRASSILPNPPARACPLDERNRLNAALPPGVPHEMHDGMDSGCDLLAYRAVRDINAAHQRHRLEPAERVLRAIGMDGRERSIVSGIHREQQVKCFATTNLTNDQAIGAHT
jgi:hypothetical protein